MNGNNEAGELGFIYGVNYTAIKQSGPDSVCNKKLLMFDRSDVSQ